MDFKTQTNQQPQQAHVSQARGVDGGSTGPNKSRKLITMIVAIVVVFALVVAAALLFKGIDKAGSSDAAVENGKYQAVFMTNGQVYFGHLSNLDSGYAQLTDIYYLQVQQAVQPAAEKKESEQQPQVSLTKLGKELHGPTDKMHISRDQILFWENLRDDSTVVKAIKDYQNKQ